eukprot:c7732_g1_i1.p1 GENE.c7732_g1_i1~~c7732_g1_i1.p1  ORF type:complete len:385 (+),score=83.75 c7732_g1_i1:47-1201(+)
MAFHLCHHNYQGATLPVKNRVASNQPELRRNLIHTTLLALQAKHTDKVILHTCPEFVPGLDQPHWKHAFFVHHPTLIQFFSEAWEEWAARGKDPIFLWKGSDEPSIVPYFFTRNRLAEAGKSMGLIGFQSVFAKMSALATDYYTPIFQDTFAEIEKDIVLTESAVDLLFSQVSQGSVPSIYVACTFPGHHCGYVNYGGYCFVNNACIAFQSLIDRGFSPFLLDVDYHMGDGSWELLRKHYNDTPIEHIFASIHVPTDYPYSFPEGSPINEKLETQLSPASQGCYHVFPGTNWQGYEKILRYITGTIPSTVNVLVVSLGLDTLEADPDASLGQGLDLKPSDFRLMGQLLREKGLPILVLQEGGYNLNLMGEAMQEFVRGLAGIEQ